MEPGGVETTQRRGLPAVRTRLPAAGCRHADVSLNPCAGDAEQLPPVGPGSVLRAIMEAGVVPVVDLRKIFRQVTRVQQRLFPNKFQNLLA